MSDVIVSAEAVKEAQPVELKLDARGARALGADLAGQPDGRGRRGRVWSTAPGAGS